MQWILEPDAKPEKWKVVLARLESHVGDILEAEACWTGQTWRVIGVGNKNRVKDFHVKVWAYQGLEGLS